MRTLFTYCLLWTAVAGIGQVYPDFRPLRFEEDYSGLRSDTLSTGWYHAIKFTPLSDKTAAYLSFGGETRYQYFYEKNREWGDGPQDNDGYTLGRFLLHAEVRPQSRIRAFVQLQGSSAAGRIDPSPVEQNPLDVHQAFADFLIAGRAANRVLLRAGRQEMYYGSQRLVSLRDGPNNRQSFDAVKLESSHGNYSADVFYSHYVVASDGIFDDASSPDRQFWGSYLSMAQVPVLNRLELYYFGYLRAQARFDDGSGCERRQSFGLRISGHYGGWRYDLEGVFQFGSLDGRKIRAWTASVNTAYRFSGVLLRPEFSVKAEAISGDRRREDGRIGTFNPLFPRGAYFGLAAVIGPSNLLDVHPALALELAKNLDFSVDWDIFWRFSARDGLYAPNVSMIYGGEASSSNEIGNQWAAELVFHPNQYLYFRAEATWFAAGRFLKDAGPGKDILFTGATAQLRF